MNIEIVDSDADAAATSAFFRSLIQSYSVTHEEQKLVQNFAEQNKASNVAGISTENIQQQKNSHTLGREIKRLMLLKHEIRKTYRGRIYYDDTDESEVLMRELLDRQQTRCPEQVDLDDICSDRSHMDLLETQCPLLCGRNSVYRTKLAKRLLEKEIEPKMVFVEIELLSMIENGDLSADEASMILSKILMDRDGFNLRVATLLQGTMTTSPQQPTPPPPPKAPEEAKNKERTSSSSYRDITFDQYCALKKQVEERIKSVHSASH